MLSWLKQFYSNLHWQHAGWWAKLLLLVLAILKFVPEVILFGLISALVSLASTMYSIAGTMNARISDAEENGILPLEQLYSGPLWLICSILSLTTAILALIWTPFLSASQCDVVSTILWKAGLRRLAFRIAGEGMLRNPGKFGAALLATTMLECLPRGYQNRSSAIFMGLATVGEALKEPERWTQHEKKQVGRICNRAADFLEKQDPTRHSERVAYFRETALRINKELGVADQLLKHP